jgi:hypothetical protein
MYVNQFHRLTSWEDRSRYMQCCIFRVLSHNINFTIWVNYNPFSALEILYGQAVPVQRLLKAHLRQDFRWKPYFFVSKQLSAILNANSARRFPSKFPFLTKRRGKSKHLGTTLVYQIKLVYQVYQLKNDPSHGLICDVILKINIV